VDEVIIRNEKRMLQEAVDALFALQVSVRPVAFYDYGRVLYPGFFAG
jgi:DNA-directed RNA polymerase beta' subunit